MSLVSSVLEPMVEMSFVAGKIPRKWKRTDSYHFAYAGLVVNGWFGTKSLANI